MLSNALKFTPTGGTVNIVAEVVPTLVDTSIKSGISMQSPPSTSQHPSPAQSPTCRFHYSAGSDISTISTLTANTVTAQSTTALNPNFPTNSGKHKTSLNRLSSPLYGVTPSTSSPSSRFVSTFGLNLSRRSTQSQSQTYGSGLTSSRTNTARTDTSSGSVQESLSLPASALILPTIHVIQTLEGIIS